VKDYKRSNSDKGGSTRTLASILTEAVRSDIISGALPPHSRLKLRELAARYQAGVIPLREALSRLAMSGFVEAEDQKGFRVTGISESELIDITKVRQRIEGDALRDAIEHGDLEWESLVLGCMHRLSRLPMTLGKNDERVNPEWENAHAAFHLALLSACSSKWLLHFARILREQTARYRHLSLRSIDSTKRDVAREHQAIGEAVLARDAERACALLSEHFATTTRLVLDFTDEAAGRRRPKKAVAARA